VRHYRRGVNRTVRLLALPVVALLVTGVLAVASPASARTLDDPPRRQGPDHFTSSTSVTVEPGGTAYASSPTLDKTMTKATVEVAALSDDKNFNTIAMALVQAPTPGKKLLVCLTVARNQLQRTELGAYLSGRMDEFEALAASYLAARIEYCMQVARLVTEYQAEQSSRVAAAGSACGQLPVGITEKAARKGGQYSITTTKPTSTRAKNARVKLTCRAVAGKIVMTVASRKRGVPLRKALGSPTLTVSMASSADAEGSSPVKISFKAPR